ncbi:TPA: EpsG family protein [Providencia rettgeri]|nr:EpsG family protein [Providencia rettgeri]
MVYYLIFISFSAFMLSLSKACNNSRFLFLIAILGAVFFSGLRFDAGNDYFTYYNMVKGYYWFDTLEPSSVLLLSFAKEHNSPMLFFLTTSSIYILSVAYFCIKRSSNPQLSFFLFLVLPLSLLTSFGYVRQYVAIGLFLVAISKFLDKKYITCAVFLILASTFHSSALLFVFILILYKFLSSRVYSILIYAGLMILAFMISSILTEYAYLAGKYQHYITGKNTVDSGKKIGIVCVVLFYYFYAFRRNLESKQDFFMLNTYYVFALLYLTLMEFGEYVSRIAYYLFPVAYVLFVKTLAKKGSTRQAQLILITCFGLSMFFATLYFASVNSTRDFLTNYKVILFEDLLY